MAEVRRVSPREKWSWKVLASAPARRVIGRKVVWAERPYAETRCWPAREAADRSESVCMYGSALLQLAHAPLGTRGGVTNP